MRWMMPAALAAIWASARGKVVPVVRPSVGATTDVSPEPLIGSTLGNDGMGGAPCPWAGGISACCFLQAGSPAAITTRRLISASLRIGRSLAVHGLCFPGQLARRPGQGGLGQVIIETRF